MKIKEEKKIGCKADKYRYLGIVLTEDWRNDTEIYKKIEIAKEVLTLLQYGFVKRYVWDLFIKRYVSKNKIYAFEMLIWKRMERIKCSNGGEVFNTTRPKRR